MKILVIFTGGTIGSTINDGWISPESNTAYRLIDGYKAKFGCDIEFTAKSPYSILSENLSAQRLTQLIYCIADEIESGYDGIIVAHGTDTLQYSAAATAFCMGCDCQPIVFVSSNYPLEDARANGFINFEGAVSLIKSRLKKGVFVSYANDLSGKADIHPAANLLRHPEGSDLIFSLDCPVKIAAMGRVKFCDEPNILSITVSPFEGYCYNLTKIRAITLTPYHSGTLNTDSESFERFCLEAKGKGIPIFLADFWGSPYESKLEFERLGIISVKNMPSIPLLVKIWIAVSIGANIKQFVLKD